MQITDSDFTVNDWWRWRRPLLLGLAVSLAFSVFTPESGRLCHCKTWSRFLSADALPVTTGD